MHSRVLTISSWSLANPHASSPGWMSQQNSAPVYRIIAMTATRLNNVFDSLAVAAGRSYSREMSPVADKAAQMCVAFVDVVPRA